MPHRARDTAMQTKAPRHAAQSNTISPGTRENSRVLSVTSAAPRRRAYAAIR
jgi:hypothetical protein